MTGLVGGPLLVGGLGPGPPAPPPLNPALVISVFDSILLSFLSVQNQWLA